MSAKTDHPVVGALYVYRPTKTSFRVVCIAEMDADGMVVMVLMDVATKRHVVKPVLGWDEPQWDRDLEDWVPLYRKVPEVNYGQPLRKR